MHIYQKFLLIIILCNIYGLAVGEEAEMPAFSSPPIKYINQTSIGGAVGHPNEIAQVTDDLVIGDKTNQNLKFWFYIYGANFHICSASGVAEKLEKNTYQYQVSDTSCQLKLTFKSNHATLEDIGGNCRDLFCGSRGNIGKTAFHKIGSRLTHPSSGTR
ncbi:hypothetical protein [Methylophilus sp. UBA6697]|jgi:hypothetical protein|uniref:hypothetical protein n=1 Tax=Methylophilus sp. UBA6697 TaxID=1946902 RepID=UPI000ED0BAA9|nr:hypothetical protein [Methylophilus sp. UBA6697]HCU85476.1 hypothetical protein [Methylophilus sp.]